MNNLTDKQEKFAQFVAAGFNQTEAYEKAGYSSGNSLSTRQENASRLAKNSRVIARIDYYRRLNATSSRIGSPEERKEILTEIYRSRVSDFLDGEGDIDITKLNSPAVSEYTVTERYDKDNKRSVTRKIKKLTAPESIDLHNKMDKIYQVEQPAINIGVINVLEKLRGYQPKELPEPAIDGEYKEVKEDAGQSD